jgi:Na+-driven multidrug efflux pump
MTAHARNGYRDILALAAPMAFATAFTLFAQWVIVVLIGRFGTEALYLRTLYLPVTFVFAAFQTAIDVSTQVAVARSKAHRPDGTAVSGVVRATALTGGAALAACAVVIGAAAAPLAHLLGAAPHAVGPFAAFVRLMSVAFVLEVPWLALAGALRGWGRAGSASIASISVMVLQILGVYLLGGPGGLGVQALPWSIVAAAVWGLGLTVALLRRAGLPAVVTDWRPGERGALRSALGILSTVGVPIFGTFVLLFLANSAQLRLLARFGDSVVAGFGIGYTTQTVVIVPAIGLGTALAILINQSGGRSGRFVGATVRRGLVLGASFYALAGTGLWLGAGAIARFAAGSAPVATSAARYLHLVGPTLACVGVMLMFLTILEQTGSGFVALAFNTVYFGLSVGLAGWAAAGSPSPDPFFRTLAIANVCALLAILPVVRVRLRRFTVRGSDEPPPVPGAPPAPAKAPSGSA